MGVSIIISGFFSESKGAAVTILAITTLSIMLSFIPGIRNTKKTFQTGMYIIYIFSFTVASMADLRIFTHINYSILFFVSFSVFGSMALHALFQRYSVLIPTHFLLPRFPQSALPLRAGYSGRPEESLHSAFRNYNRDYRLCNRQLSRYIPGNAAGSYGIM